MSRPENLRQVEREIEVGRVFRVMAGSALCFRGLGDNVALRRPVHMEGASSVAALAPDVLSTLQLVQSANSPGSVSTRDVAADAIQIVLPAAFFQAPIRARVPRLIPGWKGGGVAFSAKFIADKGGLAFVGRWTVLAVRLRPREIEDPNVPLVGLDDEFALMVSGQS